MIYDVTAWETKIAVHILPNILRIKDNQVLKYGHLIE